MGETRTVGPWAARWHAHVNRLREIEAELERDDTAAPFWLERAQVYEALGMVEDAKRAYLDLLVRDRANYDAMLGLGALLVKTGDATSARVF
ncbi:MAG: hypothetical protein JO103_13915, partial [Candidatus Eremiobacteraeota bacterium]|nr:hypothetical protein [Candidatus Eremiobacteraeota bacterium]MBV9409562.1 hypothetical protein [Candidatus Eremiobacteraeota bacterium]